MTDYYKAEHLAEFSSIAEGAPELAAKFFDWYGSVFSEGALSTREKSLIALAVAQALQGPYCIEAFTKKALETGTDLEQMTEATHVAAAIKGGSALVHGMQMKDHAHRMLM